MTRTIFHAVSLFSNCGAGDVGYARAGFRFDVMAELDERRLEVCLLNHPSAKGVQGDLRETWPKVVETYRRTSRKTRLSLLAACPPCQGMSTARSGRGIESDPDAGMRDSRNLLVTVIANVAKALMPRVIVVENVQAFLTRQVRHPKTKTPISAARLLVDALESDYEVFPVSVDLCHYGVPQTRKRTFLTFFHRDESAISILSKSEVVPYPQPTHVPHSHREPITIRKALKEMKLPSLDAKSEASACSAVRGGLHAVPIWRNRQYAMVAAIPRHTGMSAWENSECEVCGSVDTSDEEVLCPKCFEPLLRPIVPNGRGGYRLVTGFRTSTYCRIKSDRPSTTITTASGHIGSNNTIHPFENRLLSTLECALLQTLPRSFKWGEALKKWGHTNVREMIGEAVPPLFTYKHGRMIGQLLEARGTKSLLSSSDERHVRAAKKLGLR